MGSPSRERWRQAHRDGSSSAESPAPVAPAAARTLVDVGIVGGAGPVFTYAVPPGLRDGAIAGRRVLVPIGGRRRAGIVLGPASHDGGGSIRELDSLLDDGPLLSPALLSLVRWAAGYYAAPLGLALKPALPPGAEADEERIPVLSVSGVEALAHPTIDATTRRALRAVADGEAQVLAPGAVKRLVKEGFLRLERRVEAGAEVPLVDRVRPLPALEGGNFKRSPVQSAIADILKREGAVTVASLAERVPGAREALGRMRDRGFVALDQVPYQAVVEAASQVLAGKTTPVAPTPAQQAVGDRLEALLDDPAKKPVLLQGVTGSGKTEVYLRLIAAARQRGKSALVLVPEIALTPQLSARFRARFGAAVAVLHSGLTDRDRAAEWHRIHRGEAPIVVGARSAVFCPAPDVGVIVVDEEHDGSFKQAEGLRYQGRDLAIVRARDAGALVVLGSATPSLETLHNAAVGRFEKLALPERVDGRPMPEVQLIDLRGKDREKAVDSVVPSGLLNPPVVVALRETLARGEQAIVFLNRRGHSTAVMCRDCGDVRKCASCAVAMTWHEKARKLVCHYCGHREPPPDACGNCGSARLLFKGAGTEKLEDELAAAVPGVRLARLDRDTAGTAKKVAEVLQSFARREADVLVGTQMVAKGHDFPGVTLVCVLFADGGLHQPDFRSSERTAQLLTQVAGRAGRGAIAGRVLVQTYAPEAPAIEAVLGHDYARFAAAELHERELGGYPPFSRLALVRIESEDEAEAQQTASRLAKALDGTPDVHVLGPAPAPLARLRGRFRHQLLLKSVKHTALRAALDRLHALPRPPTTVRLVVDVDPVDML